MVSHTDSPDEFMEKLTKVLFENPDTSTREVFTRHLTDVPIPSFAHEDWKHHVTQHQILLEKLAQHPAMVPNLQQTYSTPANDKNNVYFMWDFVGRTLGILFRVNPELPNGAMTETMIDVMSRSFMATQLILDTKPGLLDQMTESTYPEQKGKHPAFGDEIKQLAREMAAE